MNLNLRVFIVGLGSFVAVFLLSDFWLIFILGGLVAGFWTADDYLDGATHGAIAAAIASGLFLLLFLTGQFFYQPDAPIQRWLISIVLGGLGGIVGIFIRKLIERSKMPQSEVTPKKIDNGYLVCNKCRGRYDLQPEELPRDFEEECDCGGKWEFYDDRGRKRLYTDTYSRERKKSKKTSPLIRIIIIIFGGLLIYALIIRGITLLVIGALYLGPYGIYLFPIFVGICFAIIIGLWYKFKRK